MHQEKNKTTTLNKSLSVLIHQDGLSFFTYEGNRCKDRLDNNFKAKANPLIIQKAIEDLHDNDPYFEQEFIKVSLFYHHDLFSLVPLEFFDPTRSSDYLKYNVHLLPTDVLSHDTSLGNVKAALIYIAYENINNYFFEKYGQFEYFHYGSRILNRLSSSQADKKVILTVEVFKSDFYVTLFNEGNLIAHNLFQFETVEDILYYVMFTIQQNELNTDTLHCTIIGSQDLTSLFDLLYHYIRNVELNKDYDSHLTQLLCV